MAVRSSRRGVFARQERDTSFHDHVAMAIERGYGQELTYFGIQTLERAKEVRLGMIRSGKHHGVSVRSFWQPCTGCEHGGVECRYHVYYTCYDAQVALEYKRRLAGLAASGSVL